MKMAPCMQDSVPVDKTLNKSYDNDHTIEHPISRRTKKMNFRQQIRSLREECGDGVSLASSEELSNSVDGDDEGFIVASRRNRRNQRNRNSASSHDNEVNENTNPLQCNNSIQIVSDSPKMTSVEDCSMQSVYGSTSGKIPDTTMSRLDPPKTEVSKVELFTRSAEIDCRLATIQAETKSPSNDSEKKNAWDSAKNFASRTIIDFEECPICYQPWGEDKVILEECGHSFHSECIRSWMKRKSTCPFCAGFSLLPDEFPHLT